MLVMPKQIDVIEEDDNVVWVRMFDTYDVRIAKVEDDGVVFLKIEAFTLARNEVGEVVELGEAGILYTE